MGAVRSSGTHRRELVCRGYAAVVALSVVAGLLVSADRSAAQGAAVKDPVSVFYPAGNCATGVLEIELFDRPDKQWRPHPAHPRIMADTCHTEDAGDLLNEIRVRCIDPASPARASNWILGVQVYEPAGAPGCVPPEMGPKPRLDPRITLTQPAAGPPLRNSTGVAKLAGQVRLTHDLVVLIDASFEQPTRKRVTSALASLLGRDADRPGPVRVSFLFFAGDPASSGRGRAEPTPPVDDPAGLKAQLARLSGAKPPPPARGLAAGLDVAVKSLGAYDEKGDRQTVLVLADRGADLPFGPGAGMSPSIRRDIQASVDRAVRARIGLEIVIIGRSARAPAELAGQLGGRIESGGAGGGLTLLEDPAALADSLPTLQATTLREVRVENLATGGIADPLEWDRAGRFHGSIPMRSGKNPLRVRGLLSNGRDVIADFERHFDPAALREALRAREAKRIESVKRASEAGRGNVKLEVEDR